MLFAKPDVRIAQSADSKPLGAESSMRVRDSRHSVRTRHIRGRMTKFIFAAVLAFPLGTQGANYYVTQSGAGSGSGTSLANAWSVSTFNASSAPAAGDSVFFSGAITSTVTPIKSGSSGNPITLDYSAATLNTASPRIQISSKSFLNILGGVMGAGDGTMIDFNNQTSHDVFIANWNCTNTPGSLAGFVHGWACYNLTVSNCICLGYEQLYFGATTNSHDVTIINNKIVGSTNIIDQTDLIFIGDEQNVLIQGNYLQQNAPGDQASGRHNDCIQTFQGGESASGAPSGWVVRYNWIEQNDVGGDGSISFMMMENMAGSGPTDACDIYGNVFMFALGAKFSGNGVAFDSNNSSAVVRFYNNTVINHASSGGGSPGGPTGFLSPGNLYAENNLFEADSGNSGPLVNWTFAIQKSDYNRFYQYGSPGSTYTGAHGAANSNPLFTDYVNNNLSLQSSSPCIGTGDNTIGSTYSQGIAPGATWPNPALATRTGAWDVGAYVYVGGSTNPVVSVSPGSINFGAVPVGVTSNLSFTVQNAGGGMLAGTASVGAPFRITSGGNYSLGANQSQTVTVVFAPTVVSNFTQSISFSGVSGASVTVLGGATNATTAIGPTPFIIAEKVTASIANPITLQFTTNLASANWQTIGTFTGSMNLSFTKPPAVFFRGNCSNLTGSVTLTWPKSTDSSVMGYGVNYGVTSGTYTYLMDAGNATNATIANLTAGVTYYFSVNTYNVLWQIKPYLRETSALPQTANYSLNIGNP